ncbi:uncharacterized protein LTR77_010039 [Saxophila tyrrhenica]|uniref:Alpha/beta hydrolase fold-3 domain-containing protein n=1 Tax=Saxophila tyrrhenica TaxID=1690608 RepID=A0AAV9P0S9_9PEZI|nr:hypothetical protein LTR77_010039 [Saxophila tyrrhenica]
MLQSLRFASHWFRNTTDALFSPSLPWTHRWRLLLLQPLTLLTYCLKYLPYIFSHRYTVIEIPTRGRHTIRAIVFEPPSKDHTQLRPLHIDFHGGAFLGGIAEYNALWCEQVSDRIGAVVISAQYRYAPVHTYPCAHEDAEDVLSWVLEKSQKLWNADPDSLSVSGSSAGANLMFAAGTRAKAAVGFCAAVDLRLPPWQKPKPPNFPTIDPLSFLMPLFDAYVAPVRKETLEDDRLHPVLKKLDDLPANVLFIVAGVDIVAHEQLIFIERVRE